MNEALTNLPGGLTRNQLFALALITILVVNAGGLVTAVVSLLTYWQGRRNTRLIQENTTITANTRDLMQQSVKQSQTGMKR